MDEPREASLLVLATISHVLAWLFLSIFPQCAEQRKKKVGSLVTLPKNILQGR